MYDVGSRSAARSFWMCAWVPSCRGDHVGLKVFPSPRAGTVCLELKRERGGEGRHASEDGHVVFKQVHEEVNVVGGGRDIRDDGEERPNIIDILSYDTCEEACNP